MNSAKVLFFVPFKQGVTMAIINNFEYHKASSVEEAIKLIATHRTKVKILAGGTDLIVHLKEDIIQPEYIIDIKGINKLNTIKFSDNYAIVGAGVTFTEILESKKMKEKLPILWEASEKVASVGIRNRATLTGNMCSAVPSADAAPALLVYNADILVEGPAGKRSIAIKDWFKGPHKTTLKTDELVLAIRILLEKHAGTYEKLGRYQGEDLAQAGISVFVDKKNNYRFASCAVGPVPKRMYKVEEMLNGQTITEELLNKAAAIIPNEITPITDIRSTAEYRIHMMKIMFKRGLKRSLANLKGGVS